MHNTTEVCSIHNRHYTTLLGQIWDRVTHRLAVNHNEIATQEKLLRDEKDYQIRRMSSRTADIQRMIMRIV